LESLTLSLRQHFPDFLSLGGINAKTQTIKPPKMGGAVGIISVRPCVLNGSIQVHLSIEYDLQGYLQEVFFFYNWSHTAVLSMVGKI